MCVYFQQLDCVLALSTTGTNLCCKEPTGPWNAGSMDSSKKVGPNGCNEDVTVNGATVKKYYQARIQAMPVYTEATVEDPWLETLNAVGGIIALIDSVFILIVSYTRGWCPDVEASDDEVEDVDSAGVAQVEVALDGSSFLARSEDQLRVSQSSADPSVQPANKGPARPELT